MTKPRILYVDDQNFCYLTELAELGCKIDSDRSAKVAAAFRNMQDYDVLLIDASEDIPVNDYRAFSEAAKSLNPNMTIVGMSVVAYQLRKDPEGRMYDEILATDDSLIDQLKLALEKYGFQFDAQ